MAFAKGSIEKCMFCEYALSRNIMYEVIYGQVSLTATVTCNQYYLLSCGADGAR